MERDGKGELNSRQEKRRHIHRNSPVLSPQVRSSEINEIVTASVEYGFHHVECEALGHFGGDSGRNWEHRPAHHRIDQHRSVMSKCRSDARVDIGGILEPDPAHTTGFGHGGKVRVLEIRNEIEKAGGFLLDLDEAERAVVEDHDLHRQAELRKAEKIAHQHGETTITRQRDYLPVWK